jgi:hypothetical protein
MKLKVEVVKDVLSGLKSSLFAKEAIPKILQSVLENGHDVPRAVEAIGVEKIDLPLLSTPLKPFQYSCGFYTSYLLSCQL